MNEHETQMKRKRDGTATTKQTENIDDNATIETPLKQETRNKTESAKRNQGQDLYDTRRTFKKRR